MMTRSQVARCRALPTVWVVVVTTCPSSTSAFLMRDSKTSLSSMTRICRGPPGSLRMLSRFLTGKGAAVARRIFWTEHETCVLTGLRKDVHSVSYAFHLRFYG